MVAPMAMLLSACGGSDGGSKPPTDGERVVSLAPNTAFTPWSSGSLAFRIEPPAAGTDTVTCRIDSAAAAPCAAGRVDYASLASGAHDLLVTIAGSAGSTSYRLPWEIRAPDITVVGATPAGISAALAAARAGRAVALLEPSAWVGGMMTGGLSKSDVGGAGGTGLGGIAREFFDRTRAHEEATGACPFAGACPIYFDFEPKAAKFIFETMLAEQKLIYLERGIVIDGVDKSGTTITALRTRRGALTSDVVVDATYEGDVAVMAGVSTVIGREARASGGSDLSLVEDDAGVGAFVPPYGLEVDPYIVPGDPTSGTLPFVQPKAALPAPGSADGRVMAYNYRLCVTDDPGNRVPFARPADYDPKQYEGSARVAVAMAASGRLPLDELYFNPRPTVRSADENYYKRDLNGGAVFSTDMSAPDWNQAYPLGSASQREAIAAAYKSYIQGLLYFWQTDARFGALNAKMASYGLCRDEFTDNDHWPYRLYTRETRRMVGEYVMNQNDVLQNGRRTKITASIGMGAYSMDSHTRQITVASLSFGGGAARDAVVSEGFKALRIPGYTPYPVHYQSLVPQRAQVTNLLNPVTLSATSLAYSSLRMEPAFMTFGQAAGTAAALASEGGTSVQAVDVATLQSRLRSAGQILQLP